MPVLEETDVLDLTQSLAGPTCTELLASLGAEVVKVEPLHGDAFRPLYNGASFSSVNLGKRSVSVDLQTERGQDIVADLAAEADVVVESHRPGVVEKFGLDYESVAEENENVIYCSLTGFGQEGPFREYPAYDPVLQAMGGLMEVTGFPDRPPVRIGTTILDWGTGSNAAFTIAAALANRERTGEGQYIDLSLYDTAVFWMGYWIAHYTLNGEVREREGTALEGIAPFDVYHDEDDEPFYLACTTDKAFDRLCEALGRKDLLADERFDQNAHRIEHREALDEALQAEFDEYQRDNLFETLAEAGVPVGPIQDVSDLVDDDPHVEARAMVKDTYSHAAERSGKTAEVPFRLSDGLADLGDTPPELGEHTGETLEAQGFSDEEIADLVAENIIAVSED